MTFDTTTAAVRGKGFCGHKFALLIPMGRHRSRRHDRRSSDSEIKGIADALGDVASAFVGIGVTVETIVVDRCKGSYWP